MHLADDPVVSPEIKKTQITGAGQAPAGTYSDR